MFHGGLVRRCCCKPPPCTSPLSIDFWATITSITVNTFADGEDKTVSPAVCQTGGQTGIVLPEAGTHAGNKLFGVNTGYPNTGYVIIARINSVNGKPEFQYIESYVDTPASNGVGTVGYILGPTLVCSVNSLIGTYSQPGQCQGLDEYVQVTSVSTS